MKKFLIYSANIENAVGNKVIEAENVEEAVKAYVRWNNGSLEDLAQLNDESFCWAMRNLACASIIEITGEPEHLPLKVLNEIEALRENIKRLEIEEHEKSELKRLSAKYNDSLRSN